MKNPNIADAMAMRTVFDAVKSTPKFNAMFANKQMPERAIGWEVFLLASSIKSLCKQCDAQLHRYDRGSV